MKQFPAGKNVITFLGSAVLMSAAVFLTLQACSKKTEKVAKPEKMPVKKPMSPKKELVSPETSDKRIIYLTFDDGPNRGTKNLLEIVHKRKIPVTAFVVAKHVYGSVKQKEDFKILEQDSLIEIANHSYSHANNQYAKFYEDPENVVEDFNRAQDSLKLDNNYARTPGRNIWRTGVITETDLKKSANAADELAKAGYKVIGWDLEWKHDGKMHLEGSHKEMLKKVDSIFFNDLEKTSRHLVLLTHDQYLNDEKSLKELDLFIEGIQKSDRFEFRKISEYPKINNVPN